jgi:antitoxin HicB
MVTTAPNAADRYMGLPYRLELVPDDGEWFVELPELPGCMSQGQTPEEALAMIRDAQRGWIEERLARGLAIPVPRPTTEHSYTGKFNVRVPRDLHRALVRVATAQGVSLNLFVATALAHAVDVPSYPLPARGPVRPSNEPAQDLIAMINQEMRLWVSSLDTSMSAMRELIDALQMRESDQPRPDAAAAQGYGMPLTGQVR